MSDQYWNEIETQMKLRKETALSKIVARWNDWVCEDKTQ